MLRGLQHYRSPEPEKRRYTSLFHSRRLDLRILVRGSESEQRKNKVECGRTIARMAPFRMETSGIINDNLSLETEMSHLAGCALSGCSLKREVRTHFTRFKSSIQWTPLFTFTTHTCSIAFQHIVQVAEDMLCFSFQVN